MLESAVEAAHRKRVKAAGGVSYKFTSPSRRAVTDRLDLYPIAPEHIDVVAKYVCFTECKAPGKHPRPEQIREHKRLRKLGFRVGVVDNVN